MLTVSKIKHKKPKITFISGQRHKKRIIQTHYIEIQPIDFYEQKHVRHLMKAEIVAVLLTIVAFISLLPAAAFMIAINLIKFANNIYAIAYVLIAVVLSFFIIEIAITISYVLYKKRYEQ